MQTHLSDQPYDSTAWGTLSELWQHLNEPIRAVRAEAESSATKGDLPGAIDRVLGPKRFAHPSAADTIELSAMDSRLKIWQRQQREDMRKTPPVANLVHHQTSQSLTPPAFVRRG